MFLYEGIIRNPQLGSVYSVYVTAPDYTTASSMLSSQYGPDFMNIQGAGRTVNN